MLKATEKALLEMQGKIIGFPEEAETFTSLTDRAGFWVDGEKRRMILTSSPSLSGSEEGDFYCSLGGDEFYLSSFVLDGQPGYIENRQELLEQISAWYADSFGFDLVERLTAIRAAEKSARHDEDIARHGRVLTNEERLLFSITGRLP
jgi:hypothetical protein